MSGLPTTPSNTHLRSGLPTPSAGLRRISPVATSSVSPGVDSPDTRFKKQTLAEAISKNDPAKYRISSSISSPTARENSDADDNSPLLTAGRLPRSSLLSRRSHSSLRFDTPPNRAAPLPSHASPSASDVSPSSASALVRTRSPLPASNASTSKTVATPKRNSELHGRASFTPSTISRTPSHTSSTTASRAREHVRRGRELEIGDLVRMEGSDLVGVLRHLGPVEFKPGFYAGLELTGDSVGKGKNDGSVQGTQYFACAPANGVFCPASKVVAINHAPPTDAVARPASSMSNRPSSRASDAPDRSGAITPSRRRASIISRPPSATPSRASSRLSVRPPSVASVNRPTSAMSTSRPVSRLTARKSIAHTSSARADDAPNVHQQTQLSPVRNAVSTTCSLAARTPRTSIAGVRAASSVVPSTPSLAKKRQSLGGIPTPRATKGRASMFARPGGLPVSSDASMPPPPSPSKDARTERAASVLALRSNSRLGADTLAVESSPVSQSEPGVSTDLNLEKNRALLDLMDLTPRKSAQLVSRSESRAESRAGIRDGDLTHDSVAEAVVPLSLYEEQMAEFEQLRAQVEQLEKQNAELRRAQEARKARRSEVRSNEAILEAERAKMRAEARERQTEMEEERRIERNDEIRRRKEIEDREKELKEKLFETQQQLDKRGDDHERQQKELESRAKSLELKLEASEQLVTEMKDRIQQQSALEQRGETKEALETQLKLKDAEINSLKASLKSIEDQAHTARDDLMRQIDELKDAGRETISLYEQRIEEIEVERIQVLDNMQLLQDKAQEAIRAAEARVEEMQAAHALSQRGNRLEAGSAAAIDNEALREQVAHLQDKLGKYEDQISEGALALEKEKEYAQKRRDKSHEVETSLKNELKRMRAELERTQKAGKEQHVLLEETRHALQESQQALERERAELEGLRADAENFNVLKTGHDSSSASAGQAEWASERRGLEAKLEQYRQERDAQLEAKETELCQLRSRLDANTVEDKKDAHRLSGASNGSSANQVSGLSYLVRQLGDENVDIKAKQKLLEADLKARTEQAETKARAFELMVESLEKQLEAHQGAARAANTCELAHMLADREARLENSESKLADLRSMLAASKMERRDSTDSLQKEVLHLETLVEARIFREQELMAEVERLSRQLEERGDTKPTKDASAERPVDSAKWTLAMGMPLRQRDASEEEEELNFCGLCSKRGHTLDRCDKLMEPTNSVLPSSNGASGLEAQGESEPCDDCGEVGHRFEDCPYAAEIF